MARTRTQTLVPRLWSLTPLLVLGLYFLTHLPGLTSLPVFSDEAIYIRWAQLIWHDKAYLFFSLNDGKPPLYIWSLLPFVNGSWDPLWATRFWSVLLGVVQLFIMDRLIVAFGGRRLARVAGAIVVTTAPFWYFHQRMALLDGLLTLALSLSFLGLRWLSKALVEKNRRKIFGGIVTAGVGYGLALLTKTPALFFAPIFVVFAWLAPFWLENQKLSFNKKVWQQLGWRTIAFGISGALGVGMFLTLRIAPGFGSLFTRSSDFTFTLSELLHGNWITSLQNYQSASQWLSAYLRPEFVSFAAIALIAARKSRTHWLLWLSLFIFISPLAILGKTLHPRYFLPAAIFLTVGGALFWEEAWERLPKKAGEIWLPLIFVLLTSFYCIGAGRYILLSIFAPNQTPFVLADRSQYLTEWSSGHGIPEVRDRLIDEVHQGHRVTVVTEGSFGTLPDGLLMYFDRRPEIAKLRIQGLEQYPVKFLPDWVYSEAADHQTWLMVNQDRMQMPTDTLELIGRYPRPYGAPELLLYAVKPKPIQ